MRYAIDQLVELVYASLSVVVLALFMHFVMHFVMHEEVRIVPTQSKTEQVSK